MKYIDAEKLIERLEEMKRAEYENCGGVNSKTGALQEVQELIDSLQPEQPNNWIDEYREDELLTRFAFYTYKDEDGVLYLSNVFVEETSRNKGFGAKILQAAEKVAETIGAINICLKVKQNTPANEWYRKNGYGYKTFEGDYDWLEKTLEYMKPDTSAEWSEEDEKMLSDLRSLLGCLVGEGKISLKTRKKFSMWLKSLRPQPHWKPSEEQMYALATRLDGPNDGTAIGNSLRSLYSDLKALTE